MANHVTQSVELDSNEAGQKIWDKFIAVLKENQDPERSWASETSLHVLYEDAPENLTREWMCDNIGAKWAFVEDYDESFIRVQSAWSPVSEFAEMLAAKIGEVDPNVKIKLIYEDEFYNFVGVAIFNKDGMESDEGAEYDEIIERLRNNVSELGELWDEDECDWTDEDAAQDLIHEYIHDEVWAIQEAAGA